MKAVKCPGVARGGCLSLDLIDALPLLIFSAVFLANTVLFSEVLLVLCGAL